MLVKYKFSISVSILFLCLMVSGCATVPVQPPISTEKETYLKDVCDQNGIYWQWDPVSQVATLEYKGVKARVLVGSDLVLIDKDRVTLSAPVRTVRSTVIVPLDFQEKVISRLRQESARQQGYGLTKIRKIVIDAGHGGKDPGALGHMGVQEKDVVLDVSKRVRDILQEHGYEVKMTRDTDEFISLEERTEFASRAAADLFISIHANSSPVQNVNGLEVFTADYLDFKERNEDQRKKNQNLMFNNLSMNNSDQDVMHIVADMLYVHKLAESDVLAQYFTKETTRSAKTKNRGEKKSRFFVLRNTLVPAVLVEIGFLTNPKEAKLLQAPDYREKMAKALAKSILDYADRD